ncbi:MAG: TRAP transporter substrate-binding protein [Desulfobacteraceae bacterium]|nr:MAG: TRAP transporter substrate-binding protein [Desulfobacteraceae bacterium]
MFTGKRFVFVALVCGLVVAGLAFSPCIVSAKTLKIGHILAPGSNQNQALVQVFKPYVEKKSNGSLKIEVFPTEQLGHAPDQVEGVKMGTQDMFLGSQTWFAAHAKEIGVATIPFLFNDREHFHRWVDQVLGKELMVQLIKKANQRFINLETKWHRGPFRVICSKKPIFTPKDIEGLRLRLWPAQMIQKSWAGLGAKIHTIDFAEAYMALKQGVVEAITSPFDLVFPQKFSEVTKYITELQQYPQLELITINEKTWQGLSPEEQKVLVDGAAKAGEWYNEQARTRVEDTIQNKLLKVHNAFYIRVNRQPFVDVFRNKILPQLIKDGLAEEEWVKKVEKVK